MKKLLISTLTLGFATLAMASTPVLTSVPIENVFVPAGFDSNDTVEVVVNGYLPNLCHKSPQSKVEIVGRKVNIKIEALRYEASNPFCPPVIVPFVETVSLGVMDKGLYDITVNGNSINSKKGELQVSESTSDAIDDHIYAAVEYVEKTASSRTVTLKGYNPSDCLELEEVKVVDNKKDTYAILPKMRQTNELCPMKMVPFEYTVEVPETLKRDKVLLHVRAMDGKSVNTLFYNKE